MTASYADALLLLRRLIARYRRPLVPGVLAGIGWQAAALSLPLVIGWTVQRGIIDDDRAAIWTGAFAVAVLGLIEGLLSAVRHRSAMTMYAEGLATLRESILWASFDEPSRAAGGGQLDTGELIGRATGDVEMVAELLDSICHTVAHLVAVPAVLVALWWIDPRIGLTVTVAMILLALAVWRFSAAWVATGEAVQEAYTSTAAVAEETVEGYKVIRGLRAEANVVARYAAASEQLEQRSIELGWFWLRFEPLLDVLAAAAVAGVLWYGGGRVIDGDLGLGGLVSAVGLVLLIAQPVRTLGERVVTVQLALVSARRLAAITTELVDHDPGSGAAGVVDAAGAAGLSLDVDGLVVSDARRTLLDGLDLTLTPGSTTWLDGPVASGKTTLLRTLAGAQPATSGTIRLGGRDLGEWSLADRRRAVVLCGPSPFLFRGSIADNIGFARVGAERNAIEHAAEVADVIEFTAELPDGLDTLVGERGVTLSGGQRQRIGLARAVLAAPSVLMLDGATTAVEPARELQLITRLRVALPRAVIVLVSPNPGIAGLATGAIDLGAARPEASRR